MKRILAFFLFCLLPLQAAEKRDVVERWNAEFLSAVRRQALPPCLVARNLAILHLSIWRAVKDSGEGDQADAAAAAGHEVCVTLLSGDRAGFDLLIREFPEAVGEGAKAARNEATRTLAEREDDGANTTVHYKPGLAAGVWERTTNNRPPELPHWGQVRPFVLESAAMFRPRPPPALTSAEYARDVNEVREIGGAVSGKRTKDQEEIAHFWSDFSYTGSPAGRWNEITCTALEGREIPLQEKARIFAILNVAMADAGIATWECKFHYRFWRPVTAIRERFDDGNPGTKPDNGWDSLLPSPSHPDYVSGHSAFSAAAAAVLAGTLVDPKGEIVVTSRDMPEVSRKFRNFHEIAEEAGRSRIYGGIHFSSANEQGAELGRKVAAEVMERFETLK